MKCDISSRAMKHHSGPVGYSSQVEVIAGAPKQIEQSSSLMPMLPNPTVIETGSYKGSSPKTFLPLLLEVEPSSN